MLLLCTANQCRSPMAEVLLRRHLAERAHVAVSSAGLHPGGRLDLRPHRSRHLEQELAWPLADTHEQERSA